ncbi:MAG: GNAT family N-acetyltransferase [Saprospiraceae bacterium]
MDQKPNSIQELSTVRLFLRRLEHKDNLDIFEMRSNAENNKYLDRPPCDSILKTTEFIQKIINGYQNSNLFYWVICERETDLLIGTICLFSFSEDGLQAEIGFELKKEFQGNGFMLEATNEVLKFAFQVLGLEQINAFAHKDNQRSNTILGKLNFVKESNAELQIGEQYIFHKLNV